MFPVGWEERLQLADTETEVVEVAREFLALLEPWEIALIPLACRPRKLFTASDVSEYAFDLVCHERDNEADSFLVQKLSAFFARASMRLSQLLLARANDDDGGGEIRERA